MPNPRNHKLTIDRNGNITDEVGEPRPAFSIKGNHWARWYCADRDRYLAFEVWCWKDKADFERQLRKPGGGTVRICIIHVTQGTWTRPFHIRDKGRYVYSVLNQVGKLPDVVSPEDMQTGPEVLGED